MQTLPGQKTKDLVPQKLPQKDAEKLLKRIKHMQVYLHDYCYALNITHSNFGFHDVAEIAKSLGLNGIMLHLYDTGEKPLAMLSDLDLSAFGTKLKDIELGIEIEISSTNKRRVDKAIKVARLVGANYVRVYSRISGYLNDVLKKTAADLEYIDQQAKINNLRFVLEQHEVLKGHELAKLVKNLPNQRIGLLFDFGNMINAGQQPFEAFEEMKEHIEAVHIKDVKYLNDRGGLAQMGVASGHGDIDQKTLLYKLLMLGEDEPQVKIFGLEEEIGFYSPAFRFPHESSNPFIPSRLPSETNFAPKNDAEKEKQLSKERENAHNMAKKIQNDISDLRTLAQKSLL